MSDKPHDRLVRHLLESKELASGHLRAIVPSWISEGLDWSQLEMHPESFVDEAFRERVVDRLFSAPFRGQPIFIYFLYEHQSSVDRSMALRIHEAKVKIWRRFENNHSDRALPPILPIVFYNGAEPWTAPRRVLDLLSFPEPQDLSRPMLEVDAPYELVSLHDLPDAEFERMLRLAKPLWGLALIVLRPGDEQVRFDRLDASSNLIVALRAESRDIRALSPVISYLYAMTESKELFYARLEAIRGLPMGIQDEITDLSRSVGGRLILQGRDEGREMAARQLLRELLEVRFGMLQNSVADRVKGASLETILRWHRQAAIASNLNEVFQDPV